MRTPRLFAVLAASSLALIVPPAFAEDIAKSEQVEITIDLEASAAENYKSIRAQAWAVCKPALGSTYASARNRVRRDCQKQVIADTLKQLPQKDQILLARNTDQEPQ